MTMNPTSHRFLSQRLRLNYVDWGNPTKPLLILLHGGRDHARSWDWIAAELRDDWHIVAPDLRGHGDSDWSPDGAYLMPCFTYDLAQLIHHLGEVPATIVAHSLGGAIALRYAGLYPQNVRRLVAIEGLGIAPHLREQQDAAPAGAHWRKWIEERRALGSRQPRCYADIAQAAERMLAANPHLSADQARHLTEHGVIRGEDGGYRWKFDNYLYSVPPSELADAEQQAYWHAITCPTLLAYGADSWASSPLEDGRAAHFRDARVVTFTQAGHWPHHDRHDAFVAELRAFLP